MAYDLFFRKLTSKNFALRSFDVSTRDYTAPTDAEKTYLAKLAVMKMNADAGNKKAKKAWKLALGDLNKLSQLAKKGDKKSSHLLAVVKESGLFSGVKALDVSGADTALTPKAQSLLLLLGKIKTKAAQGDPRALGLVSAINTLHFEKVPGGGLVAGDEELIEELKTRADAGDVRSQKRLEEILMKRNKPSNGVVGSDDNLTNEQAARRMLEDAADSKLISRGNLKKAIFLFAGQNATDKERVAVGSKVLAFLNKKNVQITT